MLKRILLLVFLSKVFYLHAQIPAVTQTGEDVILYDDGTWKYAKEQKEEVKEIQENPAKFIKGKTSTFLIKSSRLNVGVWLDAKKWKFEKKEEDAEYSMQMKGEDLYAMLITEKIEIPLETFSEIALLNAKKVAPDARIVKEEYRDVNGQKVLCLQMNGTTQGIKFSYYGYYYSNPNGSVQFVSYTSQSLFNKYQPEMEELLNGFVKTK